MASPVGAPPGRRPACGPAGAGRDRTRSSPRACPAAHPGWVGCSGRGRCARGPPSAAPGWRWYRCRGRGCGWSAPRCIRPLLRLGSPNPEYKTARKGKANNGPVSAMLIERAGKPNSSSSRQHCNQRSLPSARRASGMVQPCSIHARGPFGARRPGRLLAEAQACPTVGPRQDGEPCFSTTALPPWTRSCSLRGES